MCMALILVPAISLFLAGAVYVSVLSAAVTDSWLQLSSLAARALGRVICVHVRWYCTYAAAPVVLRQDNL
jgi:hypothetical protein